MQLGNYSCQADGSNRVTMQESEGSLITIFNQWPHIEDFMKHAKWWISCYEDDIDAFFKKILYPYSKLFIEKKWNSNQHFFKSLILSIVTMVLRWGLCAALHRFTSILILDYFFSISRLTLDSLSMNLKVLDEQLGACIPESLGSTAFDETSWIPEVVGHHPTPLSG